MNTVQMKDNSKKSKVNKFEEVKNNINNMKDTSEKLLKKNLENFNFGYCANFMGVGRMCED